MPGDDFKNKKRIVTTDLHEQLRLVKERYRAVMSENTVFKGAIMALAKRAEGQRLSVNMDGLTLNDFCNAELDIQPIGNEIVFQFLNGDTGHATHTADSAPA
jgi:hypothetical protein